MTVRTNKDYTPYHYNNKTNKSKADKYFNDATSNARTVSLVTSIFSSFICCAVGPNTTAGGGASPKKEVKAQPKQEKIKPENAVKDLVKDFDKLPKEFQTNLIKKYENIKEIYPNITDEKISERLNNYTKALKSHATELEMGEAFAAGFENGNIVEVLTSSDLKIVDEDIENAKDPSKDDFFTTRINRGAGYVELYDTNGDEAVDFNEFKALEEHDSGQTLTQEEIDATKVVFDRIDKNGNGKIDATEMASHLYAVSRITDEGREGNSAEITFKEWAFSQTEVGSNDNYTVRYNGRYDEFYNAVKQREN